MKKYKTLRTKAIRQAEASILDSINIHQNHSLYPCLVNKQEIIIY